MLPVAAFLSAPTRLSAVGILCSLLWSWPAAAQPGAAPGATSPTPVASQAGVAIDDPRGDQGFLVPTAVVQPVGSFTVHDREIMLPGFTYGLGEGVQVGLVMFAAPVASLGGELKIQVHRGERLQVALTAHLGGVFAANSTLAAGLAGVTATRCLGRTCNSTLTGALMAGYRKFEFDDTTPEGVSFYSAAALATRLSPGVKFLAEAQALVYDNKRRDHTNMSLTTTAGLRFHNRRVAVDIGAMFVLDRSEDVGWYLVDGLLHPITVPWLNLAYRWD